MLKNNLKTAMRHLRKKKGYSLINIAGLSVGMACCILILLWIQDELSFDRFHQNGDSIYRLVFHGQYEDREIRSVSSAALWGQGLKQDFPEILDIVRFRSAKKRILRYNDRTFYEDGGIIVDPSFLTMFSFPLEKGDPETALNDPFSIVFTKKLVQRYFGNTDPIGKTVEFMGYPFMVTGVLKDIPGNSHLRFEFLCSIRLLNSVPICSIDWVSDVVTTYVLLQRGTNISLLQSVITKYLLDRASVYKKFNARFFLQPLKDIHLNAQYNRNAQNTLMGDRRYITIFTLATIGILFIACINFMNLSTAHAATRSKEIGIRKVVGSSRHQLIKQFLGESLFLTSIACLAAVALVYLILPSVNTLAQKSLTLNLMDIRFLVMIFLVIVTTAFFAGSYPAVFLSSLKPISGMTEKAFTSHKGSSFRNVLVTFQFAISAFLIIGAFVVSGQLRFMQQTKLGFYKDNIIAVPVKENAGKNYEVLREELLQNPNVLGVTAKNGLTTERTDGGPAYQKGQEPDQLTSFEIAAVDFDFVKTIGLEIVSGRDFSPEFTTDATNACIVNEQALKLLGFQEPIGKEIFTVRGVKKIVGVVKDAYFKSLHRQIDPMILHIRGDLSNYNQYGVILIRIKGEQLPHTIDMIDGVWEKINPGIPFEYRFMDDVYDQLYREEQRLSTILKFFSLLAILIACFGMLGLASFVAQRKTKEISIRKVLGASVREILFLLSCQFSIWIIIGNIVAWPLAYFALSRWLENFAYRIDMAFWIFPVTGVLTLLIAILSTGFHTIKTATANPVDSLKYE